MSATTNITARVPKELKEQFKAVAESAGSNESGVITKLVKDFIANGGFNAPAAPAATPTNNNDADLKNLIIDGFVMLLALRGQGGSLTTQTAAKLVRDVLLSGEIRKVVAQS